MREFCQKFSSSEVPEKREFLKKPPKASCACYKYNLGIINEAIACLKFSLKKSKKKIAGSNSNNKRIPKRVERNVTRVNF